MDVLYTEILTDNGIQFYAVRGETSTFTRYLQSLGIHHIRSRPYHPETCGKAELLHGTIISELIRLHLPFSNSSLRYYQFFCNYYRPHQALNLSTPCDIFMNTAPYTIMPKKCAPSLLS
ncbi:MAG: hypothetical protein ACTSQE_10630 [Candidatus Heimdallarchaeaceae archaeon]